MSTERPSPEAKLNMSLDALIAQDKKKDTQNGGPSGRQTQGRGRGQPGRGRSQGPGRGFQQGGGGGHRNADHANGGQQFRNGGFGGRGGRGSGPSFPNDRTFHVERGFRPMQMHPPFPEGTVIFPNMALPLGSLPAGMPPMFMAEQMYGRPGFPPSANGGSAYGRKTVGPPPQPKPAAAPAPVPSARLDEETGEVTVRLKGKIIVKVSKSGLITLNTDGMRTPILFMALNAVLNTVGISITRPQNNDEWSIADGRSLTRFRDGVTILGRGPQSLQRGPKILTAFGGTDPDAAAAATLASNAAAEAAGIVLKRKNDSRQQGNIGARNRQSSHPQGNSSEQQEVSGTVGKSMEESDKVRRLRAKGRYTPY